MKYTARCKRCGFTAEADYIPTNICPTCKEILDIYDSNEYDNIGEGVENNQLSKMKAEIERNGNDEVWGFIEKIVNPYQRIEFRNLFFKAGGSIYPNGEMKI